MKKGTSFSNTALLLLLFFCPVPRSCYVIEQTKIDQKEGSQNNLFNKAKSTQITCHAVCISSIGESATTSDLINFQPRFRKRQISSDDELSNVIDASTSSAPPFLMQLQWDYEQRQRSENSWTVVGAPWRRRATHMAVAHVSRHIVLRRPGCGWAPERPRRRRGGWSFLALPSLAFAALCPSPCRCPMRHRSSGGG